MATRAKTNIVTSFFRWLNYNFYVKKFNTVAGYIVMGLAGCAVALTGFINPKLPVLISIGFCGILFVIACFFNPTIGFYTSLIASAFLSMPDRLFSSPVPIPLGIVIECIQYLALLSIIAKQYRKRTNVGPFWRNPLTIMFLVLLAYYISDIFNPVQHSMFGWVIFIRKQVSFFAFYYMAYILLDSYEKIIQFLKIWLALVLFIALYGIKQQWLGMASFEMAWFQRNPEAYALDFQAGFLRKISVLSDPASFGVLCAATFIFALVYAIRTHNKKTRNKLLFIAVACLLGSSYSGTRSCNLMIVAGILAYGIFTLNEKRTYTIMIGLVMTGLFVLFGPFKNNPVVYRISTTFQGNKDASAMVRSVNRHHVQPYLQSHAMGGGIYTCGYEGNLYNQGHYLSKFPPDSGFMKILAEEGWIGLLLHLFFYYIILRIGLKGCFHSVNPKIKTLYLTITICIFSMIVGQYSQVTLSSYPLVLFYFTSLIILYKLKDYDTSNPETTDNTKEPA